MDGGAGTNHHRHVGSDGSVLIIASDALAGTIAQNFSSRARDPFSRDLRVNK